MYKYDEIDQQIVDERVAQYRDQTRRYLAGELSEEEFRPLRLQNGLYIQRYAPMLRIAVPYGMLSSRQLRKLGDIAKKYDKDYGHFSTRQNLQLNWPKLEDTPDILAVLNNENVYNTPAEQDFIDKNYPNTRDISIDYAIMEPADNVYTIPSDIGWSDLGTWGSLHVESDKDSDENVVHGDHVMLYDVKNCLVRVPQDKLVVLRGLEDYIIVDEGDILMIVPKAQEQEIKQITKDVGKKKGEVFI